jgi:group I intron endonuclease
MHVYLITCLENGKLYVGQTSKSDLNRYFDKKRKDALLKPNKKIPLYNAFRKYGHNAFVVESIVQPKSKRQMNSIEIALIRILNTRCRDVGYNVTAGGEGLLGVKRTAEQKAAMSVRMKGKRYALGVKRPQEFKDVLAKRMAGNKYGCKTPSSPKHVAALLANSFANKTREEFAAIHKMATDSRKKNGWIISEECKRKISSATKGKKKSPETCQRMQRAAQNRTHEDKQRRSIAGNKARSEKLSTEERSRLAKIGSDAALAKLGPYIPKPQPTEKKCKYCGAVKPLAEFVRCWRSSLRNPESGRWNYRCLCKDCQYADKVSRRAKQKLLNGPSRFSDILQQGNNNRTESSSATVSG